MKLQLPIATVCQVMTEQPDTCHQCGSRLALLEVVRIDEEVVFVCECNECQRTVHVVEDELEAAED
ncbi:MAG: hypothetical protein RIR09_1865 [Pseudomonadota bacterium]